MSGRFRQTTSARLSAAAVSTVIALAALAAARPAAAEEVSGEVWLINTRRAPRASRGHAAEKRITYWRRVDDRWDPAEADQLLDATPEDGDRPIPTTIFIHGNNVDRDAAVRDGWRVYRQMKQAAAGRPFRLVIWSWPSNRIWRRDRKDAQAKALYSDFQAYYLAAWLRRIDPKTPLSLVGYSFGARVATGALHLLAGGQIAGRCLPGQEDLGPADQPRRSIRVVLVAAALDADWLIPGRPHGLALSQVQQVLVTRNNCDRALRWYPLLYGRRGPHAMGYTGPAGRRDSQKIELVSLTCSVGRNHDWFSYFHSSALQSRLARYTFLDAADPDPVAEDH